MPKITRGVHTQQSLENILARLNSFKLSVDSLMSAMKLTKVTELEIYGHGEMLRALKALDAFAANGHKTLRKQLESSGAFGVPRQEEIESETTTATTTKRRKTTTKDVGKNGS